MLLYQVLVSRVAGLTEPLRSHDTDCMGVHDTWLHVSSAYIFSSRHQATLIVCVSGTSGFLGQLFVSSLGECEKHRRHLILQKSSRSLDRPLELFRSILGGLRDVHNRLPHVFEAVRKTGVQVHDGAGDVLPGNEWSQSPWSRLSRSRFSRKTFRESSGRHCEVRMNHPGVLGL